LLLLPLLLLLLLLLLLRRLLLLAFGSVLTSTLSSTLQGITADLRSGKFDFGKAAPAVVLQQLANTKASYEEV
jgi:hypothetical protein